MKRPLAVIASLLFVIILIAIVLIAADIYRVPFSRVEILGVSYPSIHWIGWIGAAYIALATPLYPIVKRKFPKHTRKALYLHVVGNLVAALLVSIHFTQQVTRPSANYPDLGTGILLYVSVLLLLGTGMIMVWGAARSLSRPVRFLHPASAVTFYLTVVVHSAINL